jgi:alkylation response protein AidB-like acyl-CoA dehydrogenase
VRFDLSEDDRALQKGIRELCRGPEAPDHPRARSSPGGVSRENWRGLGTAGVFALRRPEEEGGVGLGWTQAVVVFEELGRALVPGPLVATHLAAGIVDGAATGEAVVGLVERRDPPALIEHLDALDVLLVLDEEGIGRVDPKDVSAEPVGEPLDPLTPIHRADDLPPGERLDVDPARFRLGGAALTAAFCVGIAQATTDAAVAYAKDREQFGRPIGSFQAVKHLCADMLVRTEVSRAAAYAAGVSLDDGGGDPPERAVPAAALLAADAAFGNGKACIQVHGGMGFTWEAKVHLYVKRAAVLATHFGGRDAWAERVASLL